MEVTQFSHHIQTKNNATHKSTIGAYAGSKDHFKVHKTTLPQPTQVSQKEIK